MGAAPPRIHDHAWKAQREALYRFILRRVGDQAAAEDLVQEVLLKAFLGQETLREPSRLRPWLYQVTRNAIADYFRSRRPSEPLPEDLFSGEAEEEDSPARRELASCLLPLLDKLPESDRQALQLVEFEGMTQREAALRLGVSWSGAKSRVQRARKRLYQVLLQCCQVELDRRRRVTRYPVRQGCSSCPNPAQGTEETRQEAGSLESRKEPTQSPSLS